MEKDPKIFFSELFWAFESLILSTTTKLWHCILKSYLIESLVHLQQFRPIHLAQKYQT